MTDLALIEASWDQAARENATFNILTDPNHKDGWELAEFFAHGQAEIDRAHGATSKAVSWQSLMISARAARWTSAAASAG
jgi:hypothetical protein